MIDIWIRNENAMLPLPGSYRPGFNASRGMPYESRRWLIGAVTNQSSMPMTMRSFVVESVRLPARKKTAGKIVSKRPKRPVQSRNVRIFRTA